MPGAGGIGVGGPGAGGTGAGGQTCHVGAETTKHMVSAVHRYL